MPTPFSELPFPPKAVLDTNVVLDWLVFRNPACLRLQTAIEDGKLHWIATTEMRDELSHVISRGVLDRWMPDLQLLWAAWDRSCSTLPAPLPSLLPPRLRCSDADDQKFIELALGQAQWLLSRDRAVLKLAGKARTRGLRIVTPESWARDFANQCLLTLS